MSLGTTVRMAGSKLGQFLTSEGVKDAAKRAARDTAIYTAAEQVIPRVFGQEAPDIKETLVRQATGNVIAEGVTGGLQTAFPNTGMVGKPNAKGQVNFGPSGIDPRMARSIGELAGQAGGQAITQRVFPGDQQYPFLASDGTPTKDQRYGEYADLEDRSMDAALGKPGISYTEQDEKRLTQLDQELYGVAPQAERPGHPVSPTGAIPATHEPESAQVHRRDYHDLIFQKQLEAEADRQHYANRIALANAQNAPRTITQRVEQDPMKSAMSALQEGYRPTRYG